MNDISNYHPTSPNHLTRIRFDAPDPLTPKPHQKLISGRYLGEILRLVICELIDEGVLFLGQNTYKLEKPYEFDTAFLSLMESDPTDELLTIVGIFTHFYGIETTLAERQFFRALAKLIGRRAARLSACGIAALVNKGGYLEEGCSVAADGSLYSVSDYSYGVEVFRPFLGRLTPNGCMRLN